MSRIPFRALGVILFAVLLSACGPRHQPAYIGPEVELDYSFAKTAPDRLWTAVNAVAQGQDWPVDSLSVDQRRLVSGWMPAPLGSTDCGSYREVPGNVEAFENEEYRLRISITAEDPGSRVRIWTDHRATGWYGELVDDCVTTGQIQEAVRDRITSALRSGSAGTR